MKELLSLENIQIVSSVKDWKEAVRVAVTPMVEQGYCEPRYLDNIINNTLDMGPYYVLCENLALLHARSDQGAIKKQIAITLLKEPVKFKADGYDVRVLVTLVAEDSQSHMKAIQAIANIFGDEKSIHKIIDASSPKEIYDVFISSVS